MMGALAVMAAQAALAVMAALAALAASKMAAIQLSVQGVAAGREGEMSTWLAGQAVLPARGAAMQVRYSANLAFLAVVNRMAVASRKTASVVGEAKAGRLLVVGAKALNTE
jgi:hypothetical protein